MAKMDVYGFGDILSYAGTIGYDYNEAHDILDYYYPSYGMRCVEKGVVINEEEDEDAKKILMGFFEQEGLNEFYFSTKGG